MTYSERIVMEELIEAVFEELRLIEVIHGVDYDYRDVAVMVQTLDLKGFRVVRT